MRSLKDTGPPRRLGSLCFDPPNCQKKNPECLRKRSSAIGGRSAFFSGTILEDDADNLRWLLPYMHCSAGSRAQTAVRFRFPVGRFRNPLASAGQ